MAYVFGMKKIGGVKEWYIENYPNDELGKEISNVSWEGLFNSLDYNANVYETIGVSDSIVRERIFEGLALKTGMSYDDIYQQWLKKE